jgi:hypothetical protein
MYKTIMQIINALFKLFVLISIFAVPCESSIASRRRRSRERYAIAQQKHVDRIIRSDTIRIINTDHHGYYKFPFHRELCPVITANIQNATHSVDSQLELVDLVNNEFLTKIYTKTNFPFTHRDNAIVSTTFADVMKYNEVHCKVAQPITLYEFGQMILSLIAAGYVFMYVSSF